MVPLTIVGNILGEATPLFGNAFIEATRGPCREILAFLARNTQSHRRK